MDPSIICLIIIGVMILLYVTEWIPIAVTAMGTCAALAIFGIVPAAQAFAGFGQDIVWLVAGMVIIGLALFETGVADLLGEKVGGMFKSSEKGFLMAVMGLAIVLSAFFNNSAVSATCLSVAGATAAASNGKITKKNTYMAVGFATVAGGGITLIGTTPNLIAQSTLEAAGAGSLAFFDFVWPGLPKALLLMAYFFFIAYPLQKKVFNFPEIEEDTAVNAQVAAAPRDKKKMVLCVLILLGSILGIVFGIWSSGVCAMVGALLCIVTGCISQKRVFQKLDWTTLVILGCSYGFTAALKASGAGELITNSLITLLGDRLSFLTLCAALAILGTILGNVMSHTAAAAMLCPIALNLALSLGYNPKSVVLASVAAISCTYITPVSTPPITMTLAAGYRFRDYVKIGAPINILSIILLILTFPLFLAP